jgi:hypothetical protein
MIQATELRIGNWVNDAGMNALRITEIVEPLPLYYPIKLAPEILKKCGFTNNWIRLSENIMLIIHPDEANIYDIKRDQTLQLLIPCSFLHQLQNIYRALTGTELIITL